MNIFQKDITANRNTIINSGRKNTDRVKNTNELNKYQALHSLVGNNLSKYLDYFRQNNIDLLNENFTDEIYKQYSLLLTSMTNMQNINTDNFKYRAGTFNNYRTTYHRLLDGLKLSIENQEHCLLIEENLNNANNILNNRENLIEYFKKTFTGSILTQLDTNIVTNIPLELKEEYRIYIERHGAPENLLFESEKLSVIRIEIENRSN